MALVDGLREYLARDWEAVRESKENALAERLDRLGPADVEIESTADPHGGHGPGDLDQKPAHGRDPADARSACSFFCP